MIVHITQGMTRLGLLIKDYGTNRILTDWRVLQLVVTPGQFDKCCAPAGSPWYLTGCWPGKRTGVDVANWRPDFPAIVYDAFELDPDGRIVFRLDERLHRLPPGRYTGAVRTYFGKRPRTTCGPACDGRPQDIPAMVIRPAPKRPRVHIPPEYRIGAERCPIDLSVPPPKPPKPRPVSCVLAVFDIDLGPICSDHLIAQATAEFALADCGNL